MSGRGVERILDLIEWFAAYPGAATLSEIAVALGMPKSSALQMLRTMTERGYLKRDASGDYTLLRLPGEISGEGKNYGSLLALAAPYIEQAVNNTGHSGFLAVLEGTEIRYLNKILPDSEIRYDRDITKTRPAHQVASGVVILSASDEGAIDAYTKHLSGTEAATLREMIASARNDGFYLNLHGVVEGAAGAAAPIYDAAGKVLGAINVSGLRTSMASSSEHVCKVTHKTAREVTEEIARRAPKQTHKGVIL